MVQTGTLLQGQPLPRLLHLARPQGLRRGRQADSAEQLDFLLQPLRVGMGRGDRPVLPALLLRQAARPELGEPEGPRRGLRHHALLAGQGRGRLPHGRHQPDFQGPLLPRGPRRTGRRPRQLPGRRSQRPARTRIPAGDEPRGPQQVPGHDRGRDPLRDRGRRRALHRFRPQRAADGVPVRAHGRGCLRGRRDRQMVRPPLRPGGPEEGAHPLAGGSARPRLELPVLEQPRPAAHRLPLR